MKSFFIKCKSVFCLAKIKTKMFFSELFFKIKLFFKKIISAIQNWLTSIGLKLLGFREKISKVHKKPQNNCNTEDFSQPETKSKTEQKTSDETEVQTPCKKTNSFRNKFGRGIFHFFDIIFEVIFACGIIFYIRHDFLNFDQLENFFIHLNANTIIILTNSFSSLENISETAVFLIFALIIFYLLFKFFYLLFLANGANKIVAILLLAMSALCLSLVNDKFLIFLALYILVFFSFQFTCGSSFLTIKRKFFAVVILDLIAYFVILIIFDNIFRNCILFLIKRIALPVGLF